MYFGGRKELDDSEFKTLPSSPKDGATAPKPSDVKNGDLVSLLLAATPPYLYNMPLVPQTFFFSEMLRSFVQAKSERQSVKSHQVHRRRKRAWREATPPKPCLESDKPLELTTPRAPEKAGSPALKKSTASCDFTAEKLANSSVAPEGNSSGDLSMPSPPLWYPNVYPNQPPYPIDPLHFFIDLRVSAHIWDRKLNSERPYGEPSLSETTPLNLADFKDGVDKRDIGRCRHNSAFSVPERQEIRGEQNFPKSKHSVHYLMSNLKKIYSGPIEAEKEDELDAKDEEKIEYEEGQEKKKNDIRAVIGLELVVDYVKQESDGSEADQGENISLEEEHEESKKA